METNLKGKRALITGSSAGLGKTIAEMLAREGAEVIIHGRDEERCNQTAAAIRNQGGKVEVVLGDLAKDEGAEKVAMAVLKNGVIDILVNNAGAYAHTGWMDTTPQGWIDTYNLNVVSYVRMIQHFLPHMKMKNWGRIINIGGGLGIQPLEIQPHYSASLAARHNLSVSLARELAGTGITSNAVSPGAIMNPEVKKWLMAQAPKHNWGNTFEEIELGAVKEIVPNDTNRFGKPEEIAGAVVYLASHFSDYVSGALLRVDGGTVRSI